MRRDEVIARLKETEPALRAFGVAALYLFGSHARGDGRPDSDIDVFVDPAPDKAFGFLPFMDAFETIQHAVGTTWTMVRARGCIRCFVQISSVKPSGSSDCRLVRSGSGCSTFAKRLLGIRALTREADAGSFAASWAMKRAVQHALLIIAEAARNIPDELKACASGGTVAEDLMASATCCGMSTGGLIPIFSGRVVTDHLDDLDKVS